MTEESDRVPEVVRSYFAAVNDRRFDDMVALFAEDAVLDPVGSPPRFGRENVVAYYPRILSGFESGYDHARRFHVAGDVVTVEIDFEGRTHDGRDVAFSAVDLFELDADGRICRLSIWYDSLDVARQVTGKRSGEGRQVHDHG